jgi:tripartite-type tricarboxylate transporter receptor subunit TctC
MTQHIQTAPRKKGAEAALTLDRLNREVNTILAEPEMIAAHDRLGAVTLPMSRAAFRDFLLAEIETNARILRAAGVQPE